jgi:Holliday junction resolvasome RuvABC endonuclease subunit
VRVLAIDPGTTQSGWVLVEGREVVDSGVDDNNEMRVWVRHGQRADMLAIEVFEARGMPTGTDSVRTMIWTGRFIEAFPEGRTVREVERRKVKSFLCGSMKAKDANVRQALIDLLGPPGTKKAPGPTYGVTSHAWQALGVAVTAMSLQPMPVAERMAA